MPDKPVSAAAYRKSITPAGRLSASFQGRVPVPMEEFRFSPVRRYRFDFAWEPEKVAVEVEGGVWVRGRHTRGKGYESDCEKYNLAQRLGWLVLRYTPEMVKDGRAIEEIAATLREREWKP